MKVRNKRNGMITEISDVAYYASPRNWTRLEEDEPKKSPVKQVAESAPKKDKKDWLIEQLDAIDSDHGMNKRHSEETLSEKLHELKSKSKNN